MGHPSITIKWDRFEEHTVDRETMKRIWSYFYNDGMLLSQINLIKFLPLFTLDIMYIFVLKEPIDITCGVLYSLFMYLYIYRVDKHIVIHSDLSFQDYLFLKSLCDHWNVELIIDCEFLKPEHTENMLFFTEENWINDQLSPIYEKIRYDIRQVENIRLIHICRLNIPHNYDRYFTQKMITLRRWKSVRDEIFGQ